MKRRHLAAAFAATLALLACASKVAAAPAQCDTARPSAPALPAGELLGRPRIALVLSGGGARGFAHVGVLRVLRELKVPIDLVVGTSMGSVVGGAYAAGASITELEQIARGTDWDAVIADRPARDHLAFRRREEDLLLPSRIEFGVHKDGFSLPPSAASNAALEEALNQLLPPGTRDTPVNRLPLPFRSVASDLVTGKLVDLSDTPLFMTMRASLAVPGVFQPVRIKDCLVVDGGLVRNLPIDMAHEMGADIVIAVNVGTPLAPEKDLGSAISVANQMLQILTEQNVQRSISERRTQDILIEPDLTGVSFLDFKAYEKAIKAGETATRKVSVQLNNLSLPAPDYALFENRRLHAPALDDVPMILAKLDVQVHGAVNPRALAAQSGLREGALTTREQVRQSIARLYGRGDLARVEADSSDDGGQRNVQIRATEAEWSSSRARFGLELGTDFDQDNRFAIKLMYVRTSLNEAGGELRAIARIGTERNAGLQLFQPLSAGSPWYVAPSVMYGSFSSDVFDQGHRQLRLGYSQLSGTLAVGRELGDYGDIQFGLTRQRLSAKVSIPEDPPLPINYGYGLTQYVRYRFDTLDNLAFPSRGALADIAIERTPASHGDQDALARSQMLVLRAFTFGEWAGHSSFDWARAQKGTAPQTLGGFLRLSGTATDSVQGRSVALTRIVMARRLASLPTALGGTVRAGFSLEAGGGFDHDKPIRGSSFKQAGSAFISVDTRFGPAYLALGATKDGARTAYVFLGPIW